MDKLFKITAKVLTKHKKSKLWHRLSVTVAMLVVFSTTYMLILPALTLDETSATAEPGIDIGYAEQETELQEETSASPEVSNEESSQDALISEDTAETMTDASAADAADNSTSLLQGGELEDYTETAAAVSDTASDDASVPIEGGSGDLDDGVVSDSTDEPQNEGSLIFENEAVRLQASIEGSDYEVPAGLTLKVSPFIYPSDVFEAYNQAANSRLTEKGNYVISYSAYYDIWFEANGEVVNPAPSAKIEIFYKDNQLVDAGEKLFSLNYDETDMTVSDEIESGFYDDSDPEWPWRSVLSFHSYGCNSSGHRVVGVLNTTVLPDEEPSNEISTDGELDTETITDTAAEEEPAAEKDTTTETGIVAQTDTTTETDTAAETDTVAQTDAAADNSGEENASDPETQTADASGETAENEAVIESGETSADNEADEAEAGDADVNTEKTADDQAAENAVETAEGQTTEAGGAADGEATEAGEGTANGQAAEAGEKAADGQVAEAGGAADGQTAENAAETAEGEATETAEGTADGQAADNIETETPEETETAEADAEYKTGTFKVLGMDYVVEVTLGEDAKIPAAASLTATEISPESEEYQTYYDQAMGAIGEDGRSRANGFARFFDISFVLDNKEIEPDPAATVDVKITFNQTVDQKLNTDSAETGEVSAVHFTENGVENVEVETAGEASVVDEIAFEASSFSVYGFVYTVDFEAEDGGRYSVLGGKNVLASELLNTLFTDEYKNSIANVAAIAVSEDSSENGIVNVKEIEGDWEISAVLPEEQPVVDAEGSIIITYKNETTVKIEVAVTGQAEAAQTSEDGTSVAISPADGSYLPEEAVASAESVDGESSIKAVEEYVGTDGELANDTETESDTESANDTEEKTDQPITQYQVFDISLEGLTEEELAQYNGFNVNLTLPNEVTGKEFQLYHVHTNENGETATEELNIEKNSVQDENGQETVSSISFTTDGFSEFVLKYTVDFETVEGKGILNLDFTDFDAVAAPEDGQIVYDTALCSVRVALALLGDAIEGNAGADASVAFDAKVAEDFAFDLEKAEQVSAEGGVSLEGDELVITADGSVELTDGTETLTVNVTGLSALKAQILESEGVSIEVISGNVPLGSKASYTAHTEEETAELVENYINNEENGDVAVAGYSAADLKIVRNDETLPVEGQFKVTVDKDSLVPVGMKLDKLYHIHGEEVEELAVEETEAGLVFQVANFSDIVAGYTIDFEYEGIRWSFPGFGSYSIATIMDKIGVEGEIDDVSLLLLEGEEVEYALYLEQDLDDGVWYLCSGVPFDEVYRLTVIVDGETYIFTVTDAEVDPWPVTINLFDYDGSSPATSDEISVLSGKSYGVIAVLEDADGQVIGYNKAPIGATFSGSANTAQCQIDKNGFLTLTWANSWWQEGEPGSISPSGAARVKFRLYEDTCNASDWSYKGYSNIISLADSMSGYEFLAEPNGNIVTDSAVTMNLKRAYDKQYNLRFNIEPAGMGISDSDEYYAFVTVQHATSENTYGWTKITIPKGQSTVDFPITTWYNWNGNELPNEKFTGNERVTVQIYTNNQKSDGTKDGFNSFTSIRDSQVKVLVAEGSSINRYNLYYGARTSENVDASHLTNYYDNLYLRAPNGNISKGDIDALLEDATDFGYYTNRYVGHSGDIEATIGADFMDTDFLADFGYSSANVNVNRLKVLKIYTDNQGQPVQKPVEIRLKQNGVVVATKTGTTNAEGKLEVEFDGLNSGEYEIDEIIDGQVVSGQGSAQVTGETIYYNFSIDKAHFANNKNVNYFGTIGPNQDLDKLKTMLQKASRVDVVILTDTAEDKARIDAAKETQTTGKQIDVLLNGTGGYKKYDIPNDMLRLKQLSDDLASAQSSNTVRIVNVKASEIPQDGLAFDDDGRYIVINIEMDQDTFCPRVLLGGQLLDSDYGQSGKSNSSHVLYNLRHNGTYYDGDVNTSKLGSGVILAPAANAHVLGGPFGGTIITDRVDRAGNELHSNNPNQIQTLNAVVQNTIGQPTTGSLELRKEFSDTSIKDKVTYFTFEVALSNADQTLVRNKSLPASGLKTGNEVAFDENGKAQVLVRAGNSVTITDLPAGTTYTVREVTTPETEHFTLDYIEVNGVRGNSGTIDAGDTEKVKVINKKKTEEPITGTDTLTGRKTLNGGTLSANDFSFIAMADTNNPAAGVDVTEWHATPSNTADGTVDFGSLTFSAEGTWKYTVKEDIPDTPASDIIYDQSEYEVSFTTTDNGNGTLTVAKTIKKVKDYMGNEISEADQTEQSDVEISFTNEKKGNLKITKTVKVGDTLASTLENTSMKQLADGVYKFKVYTDSTCTTEATNADGGSINPVSITIENGAETTVEVADLLPGTYYVKEESTPKGQIEVDPVAKEITVVAGETGDAVTAIASITNTYPLTEIPVKKVWDNTVPDFVTSVEFKLYTDENCMTVAKDAAGVDVTALTLNRDNNWKGFFSNLPMKDNTGAEIVYYIDETKVTFTSAATNDPVELIGLNIGKLFTSTKSDSTEGEGESATTYKTITNSLSPVSLKVIKVEKGTNTHLPNAEFQLERKLPGENVFTKFEREDLFALDEETNKHTGPFSLGNNGEITINNLLPGDYKLKETKAPAGYIITTGEIEFAINVDGTVAVAGRTEDGDGNITCSDTDNMVTFTQKKIDDSEATITVQNKPGAALPNTGGPGTRFLYIFGVSMILFAGTLLLLRKKTGLDLIPRNE